MRLSQYRWPTRHQRCGIASVVVADELFAIYGSKTRSSLLLASRAVMLVQFGKGIKLTVASGEVSFTARAQSPLLLS